MTLVGRKGAAVAATVALVFGFGGCSNGTDRRTISAVLSTNGAAFDPLRITVDKKDTVILKVSNGTAAVHGFSIDGYKVRRTVEPGKPLDVKFTASRAGVFRIFCQLHPAHRTATLAVR